MFEMVEILLTAEAQRTPSQRREKRRRGGGGKEKSPSLPLSALARRSLRLCGEDASIIFLSTEGREVVMNLMTWLVLLGGAVSLLAGPVPAQRLDAAAFDRDCALKWENTQSQSNAQASVKRQRHDAPRVFLLDAEQLQAVKE